MRNPPKRDPTKPRDLKVKIPLSVHIHLHSLKIVTGKSISQVVTDALTEYFEDGAPLRPVPDETPEGADAPAGTARTKSAGRDAS